MIPNPITAKLTEWLDASTTYPEPKDNVNKKPNHEPNPKWRTFYSYGPILVESPILATDAAPTYELKVKHISYDRGVSPGEIITSGNGTRYLVQPNGSLRKV